MYITRFAAVILSLVLAMSGVAVSYGGEPEETAAHTYVPVLMYHHFAKELPREAGATITEEKFREDMEFLADNEYTPLLPQDLKKIKEGKMQLPEKPVVITFDDGYESAYTVAYPVLQETGMKATIFAIVGSVEKPKKSEIKKLSWEQMKEMYDSGFVDIQSHSYNLHNSQVKGKFQKNQINGIQRGLIECKAQYIWRVGEDIKKSVDAIEENVGNDVICFSYPYGTYDEWITDIFDENGILFGFSTRYGMADFKADMRYMNRFSVGMETNISSLIERDGN